MTLSPPHASLLRTFTDDTRRALEGAASAYGMLVAEHIARQLDAVASPPYAEWFRAEGDDAGFNRDVTLAAIAGSDVVKPSRTDVAVRARFGAVSERVAALAATDRLRYGRVFVKFGPLEDLYMHAEGGRAYTLDALLRDGRDIPGSGQLAHDVSEAIVGHDSFNAGFGRHRLKPLLAAAHGGAAGDYGYPSSVSPSGFLVQLLDRLEGAEAETMIRYVTEGVSDRSEPIAEAIKVGILDNAAFLGETLGRIRQDAHSVLSPTALAALLRCPGMRLFEEQVAALSRLVPRLQAPEGSEGAGYRLMLGGSGTVALDSLEALRLHLPSALRLAKDEQAEHGPDLRTG